MEGGLEVGREEGREGGRGSEGGGERKGDVCVDNISIVLDPETLEEISQNKS